MNTIKIHMDANLFSAEVVARTAHRHTDAFYVEIESQRDTFLLRLTPKDDDVSLEGLEQKVRNDALDERLRERVRSETSELQATLVRVALQQTAPATTEDNQ